VKPLLACALLSLFAPLAPLLRAQEDEIVANLAGGRAIIHVANGAILFTAIDHPLESKSVPPRVAAVDSRHVGILFGASEWQVPAQPKPIRLDREVQAMTAPNPFYTQSGGPEQDLEQIGIAFLEKLRPLVAQLHHRIDLKPGEPLFEIVLVGYAPKDYGAEVWLVEYDVEQKEVATQGDFWQTHPLRPRFTQLYPPEKHKAKTLMEVRFPADLQEVPLLGLLEQNDPGIARLRSSDPHIAKLIDQIERGEAQKADPDAATNFLRGAAPLLAGNAQYIIGSIKEAGGFEWIVPPQEPREQENKAEQKERPPDAPTLNRKPKP
jgi:hypothetical protein